jgi:hypothetical protein
MAGFQDKVKHAANVTKWKLDQQIRINGSQVKEKQFVNDIYQRKMNLADEIYKLFKANSIINDDIQEICIKIQQLENDLKNQQKETENIKAEAPPSLLPITVTSNNTDVVLSGLICPKCKKNIPVRFCPDCGLEGVAIK